MEKVKKGNAWALLPLLLFVLLLGVGIISRDFTTMPLNVAITITVIVALLMNRKESFAKKVEVFTKGAGHSNIILMMLILSWQVRFQLLPKKMGGVTSTVNLGLSLIPQNLIIVGLFVICMFVSISDGDISWDCCSDSPSRIWIRTSNTCARSFSYGYGSRWCNVW